MMRHLTTVTLGAFFTLLFVLPGCDKKDDSASAPGASAAPAGSGEGDKREKEHHDWDGGPHAEHPH